MNEIPNLLKAPQTILIPVWIKYNDSETDVITKLNITISQMLHIMRALEKYPKGIPNDAQDYKNLNFWAIRFETGRHWNKTTGWDSMTTQLANQDEQNKQDQDPRPEAG